MGSCDSKKTSCPSAHQLVQSHSTTHDNYCNRCSSGWYKAGNNAAACSQIPAGRYDSGNGHNHGSQCPAGSYCPSGALSPSGCPENTYSAAGAGSCTNCPSGQSSNSARTGCEQHLAYQLGNHLKYQGYCYITM